MHTARKAVVYQEMTRLLLAKYTLKEIAKLLKHDYTTMRKYASDPAFLEELKGLSKEAWQDIDAELRLNANSLADKLIENSAKALERIRALIDSPNEHIALKASQDTLDRVPETSKVQKIQSDAKVVIDPVLLIHAAATAKEVEAFKERKELPPSGGSDSVQ